MKADQTFTSFKDMARHLHQDDVRKAKNLRKTLPMRQANAKRRAEKTADVNR